MAQRCFMIGKIHRATITEARVDYEGSLSVCPKLLEASGIHPHERVDVYNLENGERLQTYVIVGEPGDICLNGAAALKGATGQMIIIVAYAWLSMDEYVHLRPKVVLVDKSNRIIAGPSQNDEVQSSRDA
ncbi:aspartate 1-decarboxylase [Desulfonatronum thioautotrophicum]|uniref:aspartate 1-decarboxylase n=1 Tax=Desulfonatronum thioautotrophicum TaxID=617001 RepID=UPI0005EB7C2F|nr:aspartate 1-decarboxylase [Desulfonatronum thioautotrophicum]